MFIQLLFENPILFLMAVIALLFALTLHEYSHAQIAFFLGDPTAKYQGRLTVNPLAHLDPLGTLLILFFGFGWGKPVPFNPYNLRNQKWGQILVGLAGPASNLLMAIVIGFGIRIFQIFFPFLIYFVWINIILGVFNLTPIPPLDGSHVFLNILPSRFENFKIFVFQYHPFLIVFAFLFMFYIGVPYICQPLFRLITGTPILF